MIQTTTIFTAIIIVTDVSRRHQAPVNEDDRGVSAAGRPARTVDRPHVTVVGRYGTRGLV